jgi:sorting nexin-1/2
MMLFQEVFHERVKVYQNWQHSQQMLNKKREQKAKLELSGKPDKGNQASVEVVEVSASVNSKKKKS